MSRHVDVAFTASEADEIFAEASHVLRVDDDGGGPNDVACEIEFVRRGAIGTFTGTSEVLDDVDLDAVLREDGDVKVVERIQLCRKGAR